MKYFGIALSIICLGLFLTLVDRAFTQSPPPATLVGSPTIIYHPPLGDSTWVLHIHGVGGEVHVYIQPEGQAPVALPAKRVTEEDLRLEKLRKVLTPKQ